ncbi:hypothetical protein BDA96_02G045600 [Sorghum bicolor]|uniref:Uncharacterized protein n=2 Tax=Sorghum bicolor TaxID=4558 RepID=A0A921USP3_SORBI|nr:hypothetical protein BDA96_02G045600 [Sorghum bicolor]OQU88498.1 hypothetical protein SORBI_3002G045850 [Sorghum bicolor]
MGHGPLARCQGNHPRARADGKRAQTETLHDGCDACLQIHEAGRPASLDHPRFCRRRRRRRRALWQASVLAALPPPRIVSSRSASPSYLRIASSGSALFSLSCFVCVAACFVCLFVFGFDLVCLTLQLSGAASGAAVNLSLGESEPKGRALS